MVTWLLLVIVHRLVMAAVEVAGVHREFSSQFFLLFSFHLLLDSD